jgi:transcriptional regulator with XRE-family HTH domain
MTDYKKTKDYIYLTKEEGEELRERRKKSGLSAQEVSERIRMNPTTILIIERKGGMVSEIMRDKLIKCYKNMEGL